MSKVKKLEEQWEKLQERLDSFHQKETTEDESTLEIYHNEQMDLLKKQKDLLKSLHKENPLHNKDVFRDYLMLVLHRVLVRKKKNLLVEASRKRSMDTLDFEQATAEYIDLQACIDDELSRWEQITAATVAEERERGDTIARLELLRDDVRHFYEPPEDEDAPDVSTEDIIARIEACRNRNTAMRLGDKSALLALELCLQGMPRHEAWRIAQGREATNYDPAKNRNDRDAAQRAIRNIACPLIAIPFDRLKSLLK